VGTLAAINNYHLGIVKKKNIPVEMTWGWFLMVSPHVYGEIE